MTKNNEPGEGKHTPPASTDPKRQRISVSQAGLSRNEQSVLHALRLFCMSYAHPGCFTWEDAFETCVREFGPVQGPQIGTAVMRSMRSLRSARTTCFKFTNPACPCCRETLSEHELLFMGICKAVRRGDGITCQTNALILCEGAGTAPALKQIAALVELLGERDRQHTDPNQSRRARRLRFIH